MPGCPYRFSEAGDLPLTDGNPAYGLQLHHPRFLEFVGASESARLLDCSPTFWVDQLGKEQAMAAAINLQRDAGVMLSNLQILSEFAMALNRMSFSMMASDSRCFREQRSMTCRRRCEQLGRQRICRPWACGTLRRVWVIPGQCQFRLALVYELYILFSGGPAPSGVIVLIQIFIFMISQSEGISLVMNSNCCLEHSTPVDKTL